MKRKVLALVTISFFLIVTTSVFAQSSAPSEQGERPGPGYGYGPGEGYGPGYGYGMGPWMMGPGWGGGYGMGPWMMGPGWHGGYGMGPGMMGPGYGPGYGWGPSMMGPGYGYGPGEEGSYPKVSPEEREARAKAFVEEYIRRYLPGYSLEKKSPTKKK